MIQRDFDDSLSFGQMGESVIARFLRSRGKTILPIYEKEIDTGKGPRLFVPEDQVVAPDMFVFPEMQWIEAKHKSVFSWYRKGGYWCTGIDKRHYQEYLKVQEQSERKVWLFFLHRSSQPSEEDLSHSCPAECPTGLFAGTLRFLSEHMSHDSDNHGPSGMVYWAHSTLQLFAYMDEIEALDNEL